MTHLFFTKSKRRPSAFATLGLAIVFLAWVTLLGAGPVLGFFQQSSAQPEALYNWRLKLLDLVSLLLLGGSLTTLIGILHGRFSHRVRTSWRGFVAVLLALSVAAPLWFLNQAKNIAPVLHDITTNITDPPYFRHLTERSYDTSKLAAVIGGRLDMKYAVRHQAAYADLRTHIINTSPKQAMDLIHRAAEQLGWNIEDHNTKYFQLEASYVHPILHLRSNMVIRVRPIADSTSSHVDIRAASVLGTTDYGVNARLIREFLIEIQQE